jgi:GT2 family glycosyltransferase
VANAIVVIIPTFRRPDGLRRTLEGLAEIRSDKSVTVLVADNDAAEHAGCTLVKTLAVSGYRFPLYSFVVHERGVAHIRNALVNAAIALPHIYAIAFIDDDEIPDPGWLEALLAMQACTGADAVGGTMLPSFPSDAPAWAHSLEIYRQEALDGAVGMLWGTCNLLLMRSVIERLAPPYFNPAFGLSGGEDVEFFHRLKAAGCTFAWASKSKVYESVPPNRLKLGWIIRRSFRIGNTNARTQLSWRYGRLGPLQIVLKACARILAAGAVNLPYLLAPSRPRRALGLTRFLAIVARSLGELGALMGLKYLEYDAVRRSDRDI